jgi:hypothetical protein
LPIIRVTDEGVEPLSREEFIDAITDIYPDFQDAFMMLHDAVADMLCGEPQ